MTDNDIRASVVATARTQDSVRRDDARLSIRACVTGSLRAAWFDRFLLG
jgi:hypothetical protein